MAERALRQDQAGRRETTTRSGRLRGIKQYSAGRVLFTRFDYTTGDAAGLRSNSRPW
jgi:hydroxymethylglutaryl-CoA reductase